MDNRENSFDFLRLVFASFVIITHSYILSGEIECDIACQLTLNQIKLSYIGVDGFFIISGYLIFQSLLRSANIRIYFWKRILRVFPALFVVLFLTILLVPFVYKSEKPLISNFSFLTYLPNNLTLFRAQYSIEGVFETNPYSSVINGSLWTLSYEFLLYIFLGTLFILKDKKQIVRTLLLLIFFTIYILNLLISEEERNYTFIFSTIKIGVLLPFVLYFIGGVFLAAINFEKYIQKKFIFFITVLLVFSLYLKIYILLKYILLPLLIVPLGLLQFYSVDRKLKSIGDLSYGVYIYSFPIQQTLIYFFRFNYLQLMYFSFIISFGFAFLSWNFIEKKAKKLINLIN